MSVETSSWDVAEHLGSEEDVVAYLNAVLELDDPTLLQKALGDVARARSMGKLADEVGMSRESPTALSAYQETRISKPFAESSMAWAYDL